MTTADISDIFADIDTRYQDRPLLKMSDGTYVRPQDLDAICRCPGFGDTAHRLVICLCDNDAGGLAGYVALAKTGAVPMMISASLPMAQLHHLADVYQPHFIWLPESRASEFADSSVVMSHSGYQLLALRSSEHYIIHDNLALLLATSGSTGSPRFVRLSRANVSSNARSICSYLDITPDDIAITSLPPTYSYGLSVIHSHILAGSTIAVTSKTLFDRAFWDFMEASSCSYFSGVPYHYEMLKKLRFRRMELPSLRTMTQAGGRMDKELTQEFASHCADKGMRFFSMYGQTEATARMSYLAADMAYAKAGCIGKPIPGGEFSLEDDHGAVIDETDTAGELIYRGANVSMGYAEGHADLGRGDDFNGMLRTGDIAKRDDEGDYYIVGRLKRFLKIFGNRINLQDVESRLQDAGFDVACAGKDDHLSIYLLQATVDAAKQIKTSLATDLKISPTAISVFDLADLPRAESGKVQYGLLDTRAKGVLA